MKRIGEIALLLALFLMALGVGCGRNGERNASVGVENGRPERGQHDEGAFLGAAAAAPAAPATELAPVTGLAAESKPLPAAELPSAAEPPATAAPVAKPVSPARASTHPADPSRKLRYACTSAEELVIKILAAVDAEDMQGLTDLRVTEHEHNDILWPEFPARHNNVQLDFAWDMLNTRSHVNQGRAIGTWRHKGLTFDSVRFERGVEPYETFVLHRGTVASARTAGGQEVELRFIGSILELDGQFKALSYKDYD